MSKSLAPRLGVTASKHAETKTPLGDHLCSSSLVDYRHDKLAHTCELVCGRVCGREITVFTAAVLHKKIVNYCFSMGKRKFYMPLPEDSLLLYLSTITLQIQHSQRETVKIG